MKKEGRREKFIALNKRGSYTIEIGVLATVVAYEIHGRVLVGWIELEVLQERIIPML